jgi:phospholipase C
MVVVRSLAIVSLVYLLFFGSGCGGGMANLAPTSFQVSVQLSGKGTGTITSKPAGIDCGTTCTGTFSNGTEITLTAAPSKTATFAGWSGACTGQGTCTITLNQNTSVTANFDLIPDTLNVALSGNGLGTVSSMPAGINCGSSCTAGFSPGTQITLAAVAGTSSAFAGWSGACSGTGSCTVTVNSNVSVAAAFTLTAATLTVTLSGTGSGDVSSNPSGISCANSCTATFPPGTQVALTASTSTNSYLASWGGACSGSSACTVTLNAANQNVTATINSPLPINHIIFMAQENRSFDHYFGELRKYWADNGYPDQPFDGLPQFNPQPGPVPAIPGCDPADPFQAPGPGSTFQDCIFDTSATQASYHLNTKCVENPSPSWNESHVIWSYYDPTGNNNKYLGNGNVFTAGHDSRDEYYFDNTLQYDTNGIRAMGYYDGGNPNKSNDPGDLNYYYYMATQFATSDRWFSPVMSRTELNRDFLIGATSGGYAYPEGDNPADSHQINAPVIFELLQNAGITWKIYVNPAGSPCETNQTVDCFYTYLTYVHTFVYGQTVRDQYPQNIVPISQFFTDLQQGTLPQFAYIEPPSSAGLDEHPADYDKSPACCSVQAGANYVSSLINALMQSQFWKDSALIFTYDEFGGFYDHVAPQPMTSPDGTNTPPLDLHPGDVCTQAGGPLCNFSWTGYRVPLIVISPFAKKNYVSHTVMDATAYLKFTENRFGLPNLTQRDAAEPDMSEFFDFSNPPWTTPPTPPAQNTGGACYFDHLP